MSQVISLNRGSILKFEVGPTVLQGVFWPTKVVILLHHGAKGLFKTNSHVHLVE